jgi:hypothetical protein
MSLIPGLLDYLLGIVEPFFAGLQLNQHRVRNRKVLRNSLDHFSATFLHALPFFRPFGKQKNIDRDHGKRGACGMRILIRGDEESSVEAEGVVEGVRGLKKEKKCLEAEVKYNFV